MPTKDVHVAPQGGKWAVKEEGSQQASSTHRTQTAAIDAGRATAKRNRSRTFSSSTARGTARSG